MPREPSQTTPPPSHGDSFTLLTARHIDDLSAATRALNMSIVKLTEQIRELSKLLGKAAATAK